MTAILVVDAHPDPQPRLCHALAEAYLQGARETGHQTRLIRLADAQFPLLRSAAEFSSPPEAPAIKTAREDMAWAQHMVFVFPLWLGAAPALLSGFLEQAARAEFFADMAAVPKARLRGKSARLIVTMSMPAMVYRLALGAFGVRAIARGVLGSSGMRPVRQTLFGAVEAPERSQTRRIERVRALGRAAS